MADNEVGFANVIKPNTSGSFTVTDNMLDRLSNQDLADLTDLIIELSKSYNMTIGNYISMDGLVIWWRPVK